MEWENGGRSESAPCWSGDRSGPVKLRGKRGSDGQRCIAAVAAADATNGGEIKKGGIFGGGGDKRERGAVSAPRAADVEGCTFRSPFSRLPINATRTPDFFHSSFPHRPPPPSIAIYKQL